MGKFLSGERIREGISFEQLEESIGKKKVYRDVRKPKKGNVQTLLEATRKFVEKDWEEEN